MDINLVEDSMKKAKIFENRTKAYRFSKNKYAKTKPLPEKEDLMYKKLSKYIMDVEKKSEEFRFAEEITEDPSEIEQFSEEKTKNLPFFKSINYKLSEMFCV